MTVMPPMVHEHGVDGVSGRLLRLLQPSVQLSDRDAMARVEGLGYIGCAWVLIFGVASIAGYLMHWHLHYLHRTLTAVAFGVLMMVAIHSHRGLRLLRSGLLLWGVSAAYRSYRFLNSGDYASFSQVHLTWVGVTIMGPALIDRSQVAVWSCLYLTAVTVALPYLCDDPQAARVPVNQVLFNMLFLFAVAVAAVVVHRLRERKLVRAKESAEHLSAMKAQFVSTMSHEFRTPLNGIVGFTSLLLDTELTPTQREYALRNQMSANVLLSLANQILDFAHIESKQLVIREEPVDIRSIVHDVMKVCSVLARRSVTLSATVHVDVPCVVIGDRCRIQQVLINLLGNACKFTRQGEVILHVYARATNPPYQAQQQNLPVPAAATLPVTFEIVDTGVGIPQEAADRIFEPFAQADSSSTREYGGAGLGLPISQGLARLMGGDIQMQSKVGAGSSFLCTVVVKAVPDTLYADGLFVINECGHGMTTPERRASVHVPYEYVNVEQLTQRLQLYQEHHTAPHTAPEPMQRPLTPVALILAPASAPVPLPAATATAVATAAVALVAAPATKSPPPSPSLAIPAGSSTAPRAAAAPGPVPRTSTPLLPLPEGIRGAKVLVVDDCAVNQRVIGTMLKRLECRVDTAWNGEEAVQKVLQNYEQYDIIFMDIHMPKMDGLQATRTIRRNEMRRRHSEPARTLPIIAVSASIHTAPAALGTLGLDQFIQKPISMTDLRCVLERFVAPSSAL